jgi:CheY-like chemotaxis protein
MADNVKLLLVDDNPMVLAMLQQTLSSLAKVTTATDAADALLKAVDDTPDLLVCDYRMPGMDGRQLVEKLKSRPATANFSTVLMASKVDIAERLSPQDAADDYLEKPFFLKEATRREAHHRPHRAREDGEDRPFGRRSPRKSLANERHRSDAVARDGPQELPTLVEQRRR